MLKRTLLFLSLSIAFLLLGFVVSSNVYAANNTKTGIGCTGHCVNSSTNAQMNAADPHAVTTITGYYNGVYRSQTVCINSLPSSGTIGGGGMNCGTAQAQFAPESMDSSIKSLFSANFVAHAEDGATSVQIDDTDSSGFVPSAPAVSYNCNPPVVTSGDDNPYIPPPDNPPPTATPFPTPTDQPTSTPTPPPACGAACSGNYACHGAKDGCTACIAGTCQPPTTPTPTPVLECGTPCTGDFACQGAKNGCTSCVAGTCQPPATPTPTATPTPQPTATPIPTATPTPIPPTPTPAFNPASCTCDGINYTSLATGKSTTVTSFAKITGNDAVRGIITGQSFFLTQGADDTHGTVVAQSGLVPAVLSGSHYQSQWTFTLPVLVAGNTYRIWSQISCQPKNAAYALPSQSVAGGSAQQLQSTSLLTRVVSLLKSVFGIRDNNIAIAPTPIKSEPAPTTRPVAVVPTGSSVLGAQTLQIGALSPIDVYQKTCGFIKFRYNFSTK